MAKAYDDETRRQSTIPPLEPQTQNRDAEIPIHITNYEFSRPEHTDSEDSNYKRGERDGRDDNEDEWDDNDSDDAGFDEHHDWGLGGFDDCIDDFQSQQGVFFAAANQNDRPATLVHDEEIPDILNGYQSDNISHLSNESDSDAEVDSVDSAERTAIRDNFYSRGAGTDIDLIVGQTFNNKKHLLEVLRDYRVAEGFQVQQLHNDARRYSAHCKEKGCAWRIYASRMRDGISFQIKKYVSGHVCGRKWENRSATTPWVAAKYGEFIRANCGISIKTLRDLLRREYNVEVNAKTLWRAKKAALRGLARQHAGDYNMLRHYAFMIGKTNNDSKCVIKTIRPKDSESPRFQRMYLCFGGQKRGFIDGCRRFIGVDGCHLKGPFEGVLLSAVSIDANSGVFPLAFAICEGENKQSWVWFFNHLKAHFGDEVKIDELCFMTDRQKGILSALAQVFPHSLVRYCARHILQNVRREVKEGAIPPGLFWAAARATNNTDFEVAMTEINGLNTLMYKYLSAIDKECWSRHAYDRKRRQITSQTI